MQFSGVCLLWEKQIDVPAVSLFSDSSTVLHKGTTSRGHLHLPGLSHSSLQPPTHLSVSAPPDGVKFIKLLNFLFFVFFPLLFLRRHEPSKSQG